MNKAQLQSRLRDFIDHPISVELYLQFQDENGDISTYLPAVEENALAPALNRIVKHQLNNKFFNSSPDATYEVVSANSPEASDVKQIFHITKNRIPKIDVIFGEVINNTASTLPQNAELEKIWAYIYKVDSENGTIYLFKKNYAVSVLKKDISYAIFFDNRRLSLLDKDLLRLSNHFDVMLSNNDLIIVNRNEFEKAFDYIGAMQSSARANVQVITRSNLIEDMTKITQLSQQQRTLRKLLNINPQSKILQKTPVQIKRLAKKYQVKFDLTEDESKLSITSKKSALAFVELLNDNYLKSEFSDSKYKIKGKSEIKMDEN